jgi:Nucleopolyhedrovirus late expression factor 3 (LEF-3)
MSSFEVTVEQQLESMHELPKKRPMQNNEVDCDYDAKRSKPSPQKRMSTGSTCSNASSSTTSIKIANSVTGQLVTKNMYSVNNEAFYLFKFLVENVSKNYYGNASYFQQLNVNEVYMLELAYENKRINIAKATLCKNKDKQVVMKRYVQQSDFDGDDTVSIIVKFKLGFKLLDSNLYKTVFVARYGDTFDTSYPVQIECQAALKRWANVIKDESIATDSELLEYFSNAQNKMVNLWRIKCQQTNGNYKNFNMQEITQMACADDDDSAIIDDDDNITNLSRANKRIVDGAVFKINAERQSEDRFSITYVLNDNTKESLRGAYYVQKQQNESKQRTDKKNDRLELLQTNINQLNDLIENDIVKVQIYVLGDLMTNNYNVLGLTKYDLKDDVYQSV